MSAPITREERYRALRALTDAERYATGGKASWKDFSEAQIELKVAILRVKDAMKAKRRCPQCGVQLRFGVNTSTTHGNVTCRLCHALQNCERFGRPLSAELLKRIKRRDIEQNPEHKARQRAYARKRYRKNRKNPDFLARNVAAQARYILRQRQAKQGK